MQRIAIVGTGISGMAAAYALRGRYAITFYEKESFPGGHTNTLTVNEDGKDIFIDTAFMVYNEPTYPLLTRLFKELHVETKTTDMSFSVSHQASGIEFSGTGFDGLFSQRKNIFNASFWKLLLDIQRFSRESGEVLDNPRYESYSLAQYVNEKKYGPDLLNKFLIPMSSAVWSTPAAGMLVFPVATLVRFFTNHCFLGLKDHLQWRTCVGGSRQYRDKLLAVVKPTLLTGRAVKAVKRQRDGVMITDVSGVTESYDKVILACHSDEALAMLTDPTDLERELLSHFAYHRNRGCLHTDERVMPSTRKAWSSWNYRTQVDGHATTVYWMNKLQGVSDKKNYFMSINDPGIIDPSKIIYKTLFSHPVYNVASQSKQQHLPKLNMNGQVYFAGAYFRYGFHEDGLMAGIAAAEALAGEKLWH